MQYFADQPEADLKYLDQLHRKRDEVEKHGIPSWFWKTKLVWDGDTKIEMKNVWCLEKKLWGVGNEGSAFPFCVAAEIFMSGVWGATPATPHKKTGVG